MAVSAETAEVLLALTAVEVRRLARLIATETAVLGERSMLADPAARAVRPTDIARTPASGANRGCLVAADVAHGAVEENRATPTAPPAAVAAAVTTAVAAAVVVLGAATEAMDRQAAVALAARHT